MPEAPEVEVAARQIRALAEDGEIVKSRSLHYKFVAPPTGVVQKVARHGKWLIMQVGDKVVVINFGMSGRFALHRTRPPHTKWEMLIRPAGGRPCRAVRYVDPRGFGRIKVYDAGSLVARELLRPDAPARGIPLLGLGPDLMCQFMSSDDVDVRAARWRAALSTPTPLKKALMDQSRLAGLGNIYAAEACRIARVSPWRRSCDLTRSEIIRMVEGVPAMLVASAALGGTSFGDANTYRDALGREGSNTSRLRVYGRAGKRCSCGGVVRVVRDGRSTFYCDKCQAL